jgi:hypothetical protein
MFVWSVHFLVDSSFVGTDITNFVRLSQEFQFEVSAFHHAHEAYLVPDVMRSAYGRLPKALRLFDVSFPNPFLATGKPPALAMFAGFSRYKREALRHSQYAPRILADEGFDVVMKVAFYIILMRFLFIYVRYTRAIILQSRAHSCMKRNRRITTVFRRTWHLHR